MIVLYIALGGMILTSVWLVRRVSRIVNCPEKDNCPFVGTDRCDPMYCHILKAKKADKEQDHE